MWYPCGMAEPPDDRDPWAKLSYYRLLIGKPLREAIPWAWLRAGIGAALAACFAGAIGAVQVKEYAIAGALFVASALLLIVFSLSWPGLPEHKGFTRFCRFVLGGIGTALLPFTAIWIPKQKGEEPWSVFFRTERNPPAIAKTPPTPKAVPDPTPPSPMPVPREPSGTPPKGAAPTPAHAQVKLIFKDSPLFTPRRRAFISATVDAFYSYLEQLDLSPPKELRPIGVGQTYGGGYIYPGPIYMGNVNIPEALIDDAKAPVIMYAQYAFEIMLDVDNFNKPSKERRQRGSWIFEGYFVSSFLESQPPAGKGTAINWVDVLWDIRNRYGRRFTDAATAFTLKAFSDFADEAGTQKLDLDTYFRSSLLSGAFVVDDSASNRLEGINEILRKHHDRLPQ